MHVRSLLFATILGAWVCGAYADPLSDRNLPTGKPLYQQGSERYYGASVAGAYTDPEGVGVDPQAPLSLKRPFSVPSAVPPTAP